MGPAETKTSWMGPAEMKLSWMVPAEMKLSWMVPAEMKISWAGPAETPEGWFRLGTRDLLATGCLDSKLGFLPLHTIILEAKY